MTLPILTLVISNCIAIAERHAGEVVDCQGVYIQLTPEGLRASQDVAMRGDAPSLGHAQQLRHRALYDSALGAGYRHASTQVVRSGVPFEEWWFVR